MNGRLKKIYQVSFYQQSQENTCLAAAFLMVANFYYPQDFPLSRKKEIEIFNEIKYWEGQGGEIGSFPKLAEYALKWGMRVNYFLTGPRRKPKAISLDLWQKYLDDFYSSLGRLKERRGFHLINRCSVKDVFSELKQGRLIICEIRYNNFLTHALVLRGLMGRRIYAIDPLSGYHHLFPDELREEMDLGYMCNFLSFLPQ